ncbi:MAG: 6-phosphogluconolactonase [Paracoccaceae bacterium]
MTGFRIEEYPDTELGPALAARVAEDLIEALAERATAALAVPGGTTPVFFLRALGRVDLPWERVTVTLTDERQVSVDSPRSNQRLLAETLFAGRAAAACFVPLYAAGAGAEAIGLSLTPLLPLDVCVFGMGEDGHIASLFPGALGLAAALAPDAPPAVETRPPGGEEPRITLSAPVIAGARKRYLLIKGEPKRAALDAAAADPSAPFSAVLAAGGQTDVYYAP